MLIPTAEQYIILEAAKNTNDNLCIVALAGTGKTSTLELIANKIDNIAILSLAFNKRIADEMAKRLPRHVEVRTLNALGHRVWGQATGKRLVVDANKMHAILKRLIEELPKAARAEAWDDFAETLRWLRYAKRDGYVPNSWCGPTTGKSLCGNFDDWIANYPEDPPNPYLITTALNESIAQAYAGGIDYDDQVYMPVCFGAPWPKFPLVLCDEVQDLSPINHAMLEHLIWKRVIVVGDPWQSIYAFRGSVQGGMRQLVERYNMREYPLSMTFRVPRLGVERAHFRVPHYRAFDGAPDGVVQKLEHWSADIIAPNSAIICRNNAPLFKSAIRLLRDGRKIKLVGMEIGPGLVRIMKKLGPLTLLPAGIQAALETWLKRELDKAKSEEIVYEKFECLSALCIRPEASNLGQAITYTENLFRQTGEIQLLSIHKAKGLEWNITYHLDPWRIPSKWAKEGTEDWEQEMNARYVAETRFKREMYLIDMEGYQ